MLKHQINETIKSKIVGIFGFLAVHKCLLERIVFTALLVIFVYSVLSIGLIFLDYYNSRSVHAEIRVMYHSRRLNNEEVSVRDPSRGEKDTSIYSTKVLQDSYNATVLDTQTASDNAGVSQHPVISGGEEAPVQAPVIESRPEVKPEPRLARKAFDELLLINEDVVGWIRIKDTRVDYPVLQADDNEYYMNRNIHRKRSRSGSIFMDFRNDLKEKDQNTILYGHNMRDNTMLTDVIHYKSEQFFKKNRYIYFDTLYETNKWLVFSVYVTDVSFNYLITNFRSDEHYRSFLDTIISKSMFKRDIEVNVTDRILTLSTCSNEFENARTVVHAKLIQ